MLQADLVFTDILNRYIGFFMGVQNELARECQLLDDGITSLNKRIKVLTKEMEQNG